MKNIALTHTCSAEMDCPKEVVMWNYYDHEHLIGTHAKYYNNARILMERDDIALVYRRKRLPFLPIYTGGIGLQYMKDPLTMMTIHKENFGFLLEQETRFQDLPGNRCRVTIIYTIHTHQFFKLFAGIFHKVFASWFREVWAEDAPMRLRRWRVHQLGFKDFIGIDYINQKLHRDNHRTVPPYEFTPPIIYTPPAYEFTPPVRSLKQINSTEGETRLSRKGMVLGYND